MASVDVEDEEDKNLKEEQITKIIQRVKNAKPSKSGGFAKIWTFKDEGLAVKSVSCDYKDQYEAELKIIRSLKPHTNIIKLWGSFEDHKYSYLLLEHCLWSLKEVLDDNEKLKLLKWEETTQIARGIARGINHMHDARIAHCDLKPANIMLAKNDNPIIEDNVRIIDFGASCSFGEDVTIATDAYCNEGEQEQGEKTKASPQRDIYAFGSILIHLLCRNSEVQKRQKRGTISIQKYVCAIKDSQFVHGNLKKKHNRTEVEKLGKLAKDCVAEDPQSRPSIKEILTTLDNLSN